MNTIDVVRELFEFFGKDGKKKQIELYAERLEEYDVNKLKEVVKTIENNSDAMPSLPQIKELLGGKRANDAYTPKAGETIAEMQKRMYNEAYKSLNGEYPPEGAYEREGF